MSATCPYHSTMENGMRLFGPSHPCFTVYDVSPAEPTTSPALREPEPAPEETERKSA